MKDKEITKIWKEAGEAMKKLSKLQRELYQTSYAFRWWTGWDNIKFVIKEFFKKTVPNFTGYVIYRIKHPKHNFVTWKDY